MVSSLVVFTSTSDFALVLKKEFIDIQATKEFGLTLKHVHNKIIRYSQMLNQIASLAK